MKELQRKLLAWFAEHKRDLPWRADRDPYRVWISEAMLQQTRVETVLPYYARFMARFPTLDALAEAPIEDVLAAWSGLGYYRRARTLQAAARTIIAEHAGVFPRDRERLLALPGIGPYTAGALASIAFELPEPLVDGNVARVFCRLFALAGEPSSLNAELWSRARAMMPGEGSCGAWNQALMELGALICTPRDPRCGDCPLRSDCRAFAQGRTAELPWPKARPAMVTVDLAVMLVTDGDRWLLEQRSSVGRMADMWQLPTLEMPRIESSMFEPSMRKAPTLESSMLESSALQSPMLELGMQDARVEPGMAAGRLHPTRWPEGIDIRAGAKLGEVRHTITHHKIRASVHRANLGARHAVEATATSGSLELRPGIDGISSFGWFDRSAILALPLTGLARKVLRARFLAILAAPEASR
jgi:A/G-specific adenine glycosylase